MSSGGGAGRVPIPAGTRMIIQNLKEIAGNHSDDEIYAMLKECAMDPDETAHKLLLQDTFHEVKRKRDKRKEGPREPTDSRRLSGAQGREGRCNFSLRYIASDAGTRNTNPGKENGTDLGPDKGNMYLPSVTWDTENKFTSPPTSSVSDMPNGPSNMGNTLAQVSGNRDVASREEISNAEVSKPGDVKFNQSELKNGFASSCPVPGSAAFISAKPSSTSGVDASASDPFPVPSHDAHNFSEMSTIKQVIGSDRTSIEIATNKLSAHDGSASGFSSLSAKRSSGTSSIVKSQGSETNQPLETLQVAYSCSRSAGSSRPSSNYGNRSQQISGSQKVVQNKEWKPKSTIVNPVQASATTAEAVGQSSVSHSTTLEETTSKLEKGLDELHLDRQHVIIPNHLQVPESERHGLSFGSFDAGFMLKVNFADGPAIDKSPTSQSEISQDVEKEVDRPSRKNITSLAAEEVNYQDHPLAPASVEENYSSRETGMSSISTSQEYEQAKPEPIMASDGPQYSVVQTSPYSTFGVVPQMLGSQFAPFESSELAPDNTNVPGVVVHQPLDPSSYYTQFYRPAADADGHFSPFLAPGSSPAKYSGSMVMLPSQTSQVPQESSLPVPQQPVPVFRQAAGVHISHYPPNYFPYNQYYSPFYMPPPALHHFLSSAAFSQQPPSGNVYPPPANLLL